MAEKIRFSGASEMPEVPISLGNTLWNETGAWRNARPVIEEKAAPCSKACPIHVPIPQYFDRLLMGDLEGAARILLSRNPLPTITGRACPHPCEIGCNRKRYDEAISIRTLERFVGDWALDHIKGTPPKEETGRRVAIVGSGPAGLAAAYYLREKGHTVVVYEKSDRPGGLLAEGIPEYRLPSAVVEKEIEAFRRMGVTFRTGVEVGKDISVQELLEQYDAVFVAAGAHKERRMKIPGEEHFISGLEFLREVKRGNRKPPGKRVAVIGGGNSAMDVARTLLRLGAEPVVLYRRTRKEMPAIEEEIEKAFEDGIEFQFLTLPVSARKTEEGKIELTCVRMQLGEPDASGRRRPIPIEGSEFTLRFDAVITAIGEYADTSIVPPEVLDQDGWVVADRDTGQTAIPKLFAGGDFVTGPSLIVKAMAWGRNAALAIDRFLRGEPVKVVERPARTVSYKFIQTEYFPHEPRVPQPHLPVSERIRRYDAEEDLGYDLEMALKEAERCFSCGHCNRCGICWAFCPDAAIRWTDEGPQIEYAYCKGCGICAAECPRGIITLEQERVF